MKKNTMERIATALSTLPEYAEEYAEVIAELNKEIEAKRIKALEYTAAREAVLSVMSDAPHTVAEIYEMCKDRLPYRFSKNRVQYGLLNYWTDAVVKVEIAKGANQYRLK